MVKEKQGMAASRVKQQEDFKAGQKKRAEVTAQVRVVICLRCSVVLTGTIVRWC
jgi:hypothetical protein